MIPTAESNKTRSMWLGELPRHWAERRLSHVAECWTSNVDKHTVDGQPPVRLCNYTDVYKNETITSSIDFMKATATQDQVERFRLRSGDTLITKDSETVDDIGVPAFVSYEADDLICGYHLALIRPDPAAVHPRFLFWALASQPMARQWGVLAAGVTRVGLRSGDIARASIPVPPLSEQRAIADFLDRETGQIDRLIEKQEQLIDTLRERRAAAIWYAVAVSGEGWALDRLGRHSRVGNGSTPSRENLRYWSGGSTPWLNSGSVNRRRIDSSDQFVTDLALRECHLPLVSPGSVLVALTGQGKTRGTAALLDIEATVSQHLAYVTPDRSRWNAEYLFYALTAAYDHLRMVSDENGSTKGGLTCQDLKAFKLPLRGLDEQRVIAEQLDDQTGRIGVLIERAERFIGLARERRAALVSAAVTGRIDVRGSV